ncbi:MAG: EAL domain-containing protein [Verrucomicrobiales bacterium]
MRNPARVLVVDDQVEIIDVLGQALKIHGLEALSAETGRGAMNILLQEPVDAVLLDLGLPDMGGYELCRWIKQRPQLERIPIIMLSGMTSQEDKLKGFGLGVTDYITKPFNLRELVARVTHHVAEKQKQDEYRAMSEEERQASRRELFLVKQRFEALASNAHDLLLEVGDNGKFLYVSPNSRQILGFAPEEFLSKNIKDYVHPEDQAALATMFDSPGPDPEKADRLVIRMQRMQRGWSWLDVSVRPFVGAEGESRSMLVARDVTEVKLTEQRLAYYANRDQLTGLLSRRRFEELLVELEMRPHTLDTGCILYMDVDNLKFVNDTLGHGAGDEMLIQVAHLLASCLGDQAEVARFGGDEFVALLAGKNIEQAEQAAQKILTEAVELQYVNGNRSFDLSISIGVASFEDNVRYSETLSRADMACYAAKLRGRKSYQVYHPDAVEIAQLLQDSDIHSLVRSAMREKRLELWLQPVRRIAARQLQWCEALLRLRKEDGTIIAPGGFLTSAERYGMMPEIDMHVLEMATNLLATTRLRALSVNVSATSIGDEGFADVVRGLLESKKLEARRLIIEVTETACISNVTEAKRTLAALRQVGVRVAIDDFGSGFSSLAYLRDLPVDLLKIDGSFVRGIDKEPLWRELVRAVKHISSILGVETVVECVETQEEFNAVEAIGVDYAQGYLIAHPRPWMMMSEFHAELSMPVNVVLAETRNQPASAG